MSGTSNFGGFTAPQPPAFQLPQFNFQPQPNNNSFWGNNNSNNNSWGNSNSNSWRNNNRNNWNDDYEYNRPQRNYTRSQPQYYDNGGSTTQWSAPPPPKVYSQRPIRIICTADGFAQCSYALLNASGKTYEYTMTGGDRQNLKETTDWRIRYNQGNDRGYKTYSLKGGKVYELRQSHDGTWSFYTVGEL